MLVLVVCRLFVDHVTKLVAAFGRGALMAKTEHGIAYSDFPVCASDQHFMGLEWNDTIYTNRVLFFGHC